MGSIIIGIDTGGTFTDGFFAERNMIKHVKVDTTPHDLTVGFLECLKEGAKELDYGDFSVFLQNVQVIRFSSTTATNVIVQKKGSKTGLLVSEQYHGENEYVDEKLTRIVDIDNMDEDCLIETVKEVLDMGARILVISYRGAHLEKRLEQRTKEIIRKTYPNHYLGSVPLILGSEFCNHPDEGGRTNLALLNAYVHKSVSRVMYQAEDNLRQNGYKKPLLIAHSNGGCSRVAKTRAIDTIGSSPVAGYLASQYWAERYDIKNVITIDVGGTSFDVGMIIDRLTSWKDKELFGTPIATPVVGVYSFALGGGSICSVDNHGRVKVGPESAGAVPGPACYGLGGQFPTVTDADVILGRVNPDYFLGGRRTLDKNSSFEAINEHIAQNLGIKTEQAALAVAFAAARMGAEELARMIDHSGKKAEDYVLFSLGGAGGTRACEVADILGIKRVFTFPWSSISGAYGTSLMDVVHVYMTSCLLPLTVKGQLALDFDRLNHLIEEERRKGLRDMAGEGFAAADVYWRLDVEIYDQDLDTTYILPVPDGNVNSRRNAEQLVQACGATAGSNLRLNVAYVKACCSVPVPETVAAPSQNGDAGKAVKGQRHVLGEGWPESTLIYDLEALTPGARLFGPTILEGVDTTFVLPPSWEFSVDAYANGVATKIS